MIEVTHPFTLPVCVEKYRSVRKSLCLHAQEGGLQGYLDIVVVHAEELDPHPYLWRKPMKPWGHDGVVNHRFHLGREGGCAATHNAGTAGPHGASRTRGGDAETMLLHTRAPCSEVCFQVRLWWPLRGTSGGWLQAVSCLSLERGMPPTCLESPERLCEG